MIQSAPEPGKSKVFREQVGRQEWDFIFLYLLQMLALVSLFADFKSS